MIVAESQNARARAVIRRKTAHLRMRLASVGGIMNAGKVYNTLRGSGRKEGRLYGRPSICTKGL